MANQLTLEGNLGRDPEIRTYGDGKRMMILNLATSADFQTADGWQKRDPDWHFIKVFNEQVIRRIEAAGFKKGSTVEVLATLKPGKFTDQQTGEERYTNDVVVQDRFHT
ncbi:MAG: single-stranded DNA-binding protein, partial [Caulobacteraceae bacterium]